MDAVTWTVQGGWQKAVTDLGMTSVWGQYAKSENVAGDNSSAHSIALGLNQKIDAAASSLYLTYENTAIDTSVTSGVDAQSISAVTAGMTINF